MKNYWASDYALNKRSADIVYRFANEVVTVTLKDYLEENPGKTEADFLALKAVSDEIYHQQEKAEHAETYRNISLHICKDVFVCSAEETLEAQSALRELEQLKELLEAFIAGGILTEVQRRRFRLYCFHDLSTRQIARLDGVSQCSVWECLQACQKKFEKFLVKHPVTPHDFLQ